MKNRKILMLLSLVLALTTAGAALYWLKYQGAETAKPVEKAEIWTAKEEIPSGTKIEEAMLEKIQISKDQIPPTIYTDSKEIVGKYAKETILKGESFPTQRLYSEEDQLLSMRLEPGYRAFSITMTRFSGVADLVKSGDRVDIFIFLKEIAGNDKVVRPDIAQIMLQNVEVLAVRKETKKDAPPPEEVVEIYAVTVAVPVKAVEKLILAEETGLIKLALRPMEDTNTYTSYGVIWKELLMDPSFNIRDFEPEYGTVEGMDILTTAKPNMPQPEQPVTDPVEDQPADKTPTAITTPSASSQIIPAEPSQPIKKPTYTVYTVQTGDTLMSISRKFFKGSASHYDDIMRMNGLSDQTIRPGQKLKIPLSGR